MDPIVLPTGSGSIELRPAGSASCDGCPTHGGGLLEVTVPRMGLEPAKVLFFCGNCVSSAFALQMRGRRAALSRARRKS